MIQISDNEFAKLTGYMRDNFGINLVKKRTLIESRLNNYLVRKGYQNYRDYLEYALGEGSGDEVGTIINFLTTNYSYFMREWEHFRFLKETALPEIEKNMRDGDLRTWSAGCSAGQEPYTLSMLISDYMDERGLKWDAKVLATDISMKALESAKKGVYDNESLKNLPPAWKMTYFNKTADGRCEAKQSLKDEVIFRSFNLMEGSFPFKKKFHIIFCRNVMIYFNENTKRELIDKFYDATADGGYLFIGQSESIDKGNSKYRFLRPSIYQKAVCKNG